MKTRKEMKEEYKQMKFQMGVFQIKNTVSGKVWIGSSLDLKAAWHSQRFQLEAGLHPNAALQHDWKTLGSTCFVYEILDEIKEKDETLDAVKEIKVLETMIIEAVEPFGDKGYNRKPLKK
jgi:hypothetical protein